MSEQDTLLLNDTFKLFKGKIENTYWRYFLLLPLILAIWFMQIATYNLNGIRAAINRGWLTWLQEKNFDVICVQELKAEPGQLDISVFERMGYHAYWHPAVKKGYSGVGIFTTHLPDNIVTGCGCEEYDFEGRILRADFGDISIYSIYFPSGTMGDVRQEVKYKFLDFIYNFLHDVRKTRSKLIVCGDYNIANKEIDIHDPVRNKNITGFLQPERDWLDKFFQSGFVDSFRYLNKDPHHYTWWSFWRDARSKNKGWRIDYISITENLISNLKSAQILPDAIHSDHCPMMIEIDW